MRKIYKKIIGLISISLLLSTFALNNTVLAEDDPVRRIVFDNSEHEVLNLDIKKKVTSVDPLHPAPEDAIFTFRVQLSESGEEGSYKNAKDKSYSIYNEKGFEVFKYINRADGSEEYWTEKEYNARSDKAQYVNEGLTTSSTGIVKLKAGWTATVEDLDNGINYRVSEILPADTDDGTWKKLLPVEEYESGKITTDENLAYFENSFEPFESKKAELYVLKKINRISGFESPENGDFTFMITVNGKPYANKTYYEIDGDLKIGRKTDSKGEFTIKGEQKAFFDDLEMDDEFVVYERKSDGWWNVDSESSKADIEEYDVMQYGAIGKKLSVTFINSNVNFVVKKSVVDNDGNPLETPDDTEFTFILRDAEGKAVSDAGYYVTDRKDNTSDKKYTGNDGSFTLKSGEKAQFVGIEVGTEFTVTEEATEGYQLIEPVSVNPENGYKSVIKNGGEVFTFKNKQQDKEGELQVLKKVAYPDDEIPEDGDSVKFTFVLEESYDGENWKAKADTYYVTYVGGVETPLHTADDGSFTLSANQSAVFSRLIMGCYYRVKEVSLPDGYTIDEELVTKEGLMSEDSLLRFTFTNVYHKKYDISIGKVSSKAKDPKPLLEGAEFTVYEDAECTAMINGGSDAVMTYDAASGTYRMCDLSAGTYYIKETKAPEGFNLNSHVYKLEIRFELVDGKYEDNVYLDNEKVTLTEKDGKGSCYIERKTAENNNICFEVSDDPISVPPIIPEIPFTGVVWWPAALLIIAGTAILVYSRKKKNK